MGFPPTRPPPPPPPKARPDDTYRIDRIDDVFRERSADVASTARGGVLIGFILGAIAGAAAVLLLT